jgi:hypothetical protein
MSDAKVKQSIERSATQDIRIVGPTHWGGRLVAICADGPRQNATLKPLAEDSGGTWEPLPAGTFKEQGTGVNTVLLVIEG